MHISQWITLPIQLCLVLSSFCANFATFTYYAIDGFNLLSSYSLHLLFCCVLIYSRFDMIDFLWALFCAAIRTDSISLIKFPFLSHVQVSRVRCYLLVVYRVVFPSLFCFLIIVFLLSIVWSVLFSDGCNQSLLPVFSMLSSSRWIDASNACLQY